MATDGEINPDLGSQVLNQIDYSSTVAQPIKAMFDSQIASSEASLKYVMNVCFEKGTEADDGTRKAIYAEVEYQEIDGENNILTRKLRVPMICLIKIPQLEIDTSTVTFDVEVSQTATLKQDIEAGGELGGSIGWGPFSVNLTAKASYSRSNTRKSDTRAKQAITINMKQAEPAEGMNLVLEILREASLGTKRIPQLPAPA